VVRIIAQGHFDVNEENIEGATLLGLSKETGQSFFT
jgi:hypothetical protein